MAGHRSVTPSHCRWLLRASVWKVPQLIKFGGRYVKESNARASIWENQYEQPRTGQDRLHSKVSGRAETACLVNVFLIVKAFYKRGLTDLCSASPGSGRPGARAPAEGSNVDRHRAQFGSQVGILGDRGRFVYRWVEYRGAESHLREE